MSFTRLHVGALLSSLLLYGQTTLGSINPVKSDSIPFFHSISRTDSVCPGINGPAPSFAGFIGLNKDTPATPKRSFFWFFEAEQGAESAPIILTMGGGPGSSGMMNALLYQAPCIFTRPNGTMAPNPDRWTEKFNLLALDHPVGVGFSYGIGVNNSQSAAEDVYDFFQKFYQLYPNLSQNQLVLADGSYGGVYLAHISSVINEHNKALGRTKKPGHVHINLESIMLHNPIFDVLTHYTWMLHYRCVLHQVYNVTTCQEALGYLGPCLESIQYAFELPSVENSVAAQDVCFGSFSAGSTNGILLEDIRKRCDSDDLFVCYPEYIWASNFFDDPKTKSLMRVPDNITFKPDGEQVTDDFFAAGDIVQPHHRLYIPVLKDGIRILYYVGAQDANCGWPGILSSIKLLESPYQQEFLKAKDAPWPSRNITVRKVGEGAGNLAYVLLQDAGHTVGQDQPTLVKEIVEKWIRNVEFF